MNIVTLGRTVPKSDQNIESKAQAFITELEVLYKRLSENPFADSDNLRITILGRMVLLNSYISLNNRSY